MGPNPLFVQLDLGGVWRIGLFFGVAAGLVFWIRDGSLPLNVKLLWGYVLLYALFILEFPVVLFGELNTAYQATAGQAFVEALFIPMGAFHFKKQIPRVLPYFVVYALACVWGHWNGLLVAPSFSLAFAALAFPFVPWWVNVATVATVLGHHGTTALVILAAQLFAYTLHDFKRQASTFAVFVVLLLCVAYTNTGAMFDSGARLHVFAEFMRFWAKEPMWVIFGVGPGSFIWTSILLQPVPYLIHLQMHSDWLQILWELGLVGFGLALWTWTAAVKNAWGNPRLVSALFGAAAFGLTYYPLRFYPTALLTAYIVVAGFNYKSDS